MRPFLPENLLPPRVVAVDAALPWRAGLAWLFLAAGTLALFAGLPGEGALVIAP